MLDVVFRSALLNAICVIMEVSKGRLVFFIGDVTHGIQWNTGFSKPVSKRGPHLELPADVLLSDGRVRGVDEPVVPQVEHLAPNMQLCVFGQDHLFSDSMRLPAQTRQTPACSENNI